MDPKMTQGVKRDKHLGRMLGVWAGRIAEENAADAFNSNLVAEIHRSFKENYVGNEKQYVNIADPNNPDPIIRDAWKTLGPKIKEEFAAAFGEKDYVMVPKDQVKDAIGYRAASTTDAWTGISRWDKKTQADFKKMATRMLGHNAYAKLKKSEQVVQDTVSYAKTTMIIRSITVAMDNLGSNQLHLNLRGIPPWKAIPAMISKWIEVTQYVKNREEIKKLEVDIASNYNRTSDRLRAEARIKALQDANDKLTIKPLIDAGEFSTISENLTEADVEIREGRLGDYLEKVTDKLPGWAQTGVKNVLITKDTALFQALNRMVQYGDFVAKAVLYDHLTQEKGVQKQDAMDEIFEEFVPYNRLPGRGRDTLESFGLLWFLSYKLRIQKIAALFTCTEYCTYKGGETGELLWIS